MAKPKGATLTRLFAVSDEERKQFWADLEARKGTAEKGIPETGCVPDKGIPERGSVPEKGIPETGGVPKTGIQNEDLAVEIGSTPAAEIPETGSVPDTGIPETGGASERGIPARGSVPEQDIPDIAPQSINRKIHKAIKVQDGHSLGEQAVYAALWAVGQPSGDDHRRVTIGYKTLSQVCGLTVNNSKKNIQALCRKLAIDQAESATWNTGTTYLVYSYQAILQRRRQAGMTHVIKTRGVTFVNPETGIPVSGIPDTPRGIPVSGVPEIKSGIPVPDKSGIPDSGTHIRNRNLLKEEEIQEPSSSVFSVVAQAGRQHGVILDDDAVRRIVLRCKTFDESATDKEVAYFVQAKILQLRNSRNVDNFVGLLIKAVPEFFAPPATELKNLREQISAKTAESRELARRILDDPEASDNDREWARAALQNEA